MNILFIDFDDIRNPLLSGGQARATYEIGRRLAAMGHKITVISSRYPGSKERFEKGINYKHIGIGTRNIRINNALYILLLPFTIARIKADVIFECFTAPISTLLTPLWTRTPVIAIPSTFDARRFSDLYHIPFYLIERFGAKLYKYFLPFSEAIDKQMRRLNPNIISRIVPEGVDESFFKIKRKKAKHILYVGRLDMHQKGVDLLLEAFSKIERKFRLPLFIVGSGPDEEKVRKLINELEISKRVVMCGPIYGKEKIKILEEALFVVIPSRGETFSCFALEAVASGLPIVSFDIPGLSWMNGEVSFKARPYNTDELGRLILKMSNSNVVRRMSKDARIFASSYSWDAVADEYVKFAKKVVYEI